MSASFLHAPVTSWYYSLAHTKLFHCAGGTNLSFSPPGHQANSFSAQKILLKSIKKKITGVIFWEFVIWKLGAGPAATTGYSRRDRRTSTYNPTIQACTNHIPSFYHLAPVFLPLSCPTNQRSMWQKNSCTFPYNKKGCIHCLMASQYLQEFSIVWFTCT